MNPWKGLKRLPRNIWLISAGTLINRAGSMVMPFLALYLTQGLGYSVADSGLVIASYGIGSFICAPLAGKLSDKIGSLTLMRYSLVLSGFGFLLYSFITDYYLLFAVSIGLALVSESFRPASMAFIADQTSPEQRKMSFTLYRLAINLGMSIGPVVGGFLSMIDFSLLFYFDAATSFASGIFFFLSKWEVEKIHTIESGEKKNTDGDNSSILKDYNLLYFLFAFLPMLIVFFQIMSTVPLYIVKELGYERSTFGLLMAINTVMIIFIEVPVNSAMGNVPDRKALVIGGLFTAIGFGSMAFARDIIPLVISIVIWTFGEMIIFPSSSTYISKVAVKGKTGEYMGYYQMTAALSLLVAPAAGTWALQTFGSFNLWIYSFVFGMISSILMLGIKIKK